MPPSLNLPRLACLSLGLLALAACAGRPSPSPEAQEVHDPAEGVNRGVFAANQFVDRNLLAPVARSYRDNVPQAVRSSVGHFATNLRQPVVLTNDLLQGNATRAWTTTRRFVVNSTAGVGGLFDPAADHLGLPGHEANFGQTFGVWGMGPGPAVHLPLLGPSNLRDATGTALGFVANPLSFIPGGAMGAIGAVGTGARIVDGRANMLEATDALMASSLDPYAAMRSAQAQHSARMVEEGIRGTRARVDISVEPAPQP